MSLYRPRTREFILRDSYSPDATITRFDWGNFGDIPLSGDWDGDGEDTVGLLSPSTRVFTLTNGKTRPDVDNRAWWFDYGDPGAIPLAGDWDGDGKDTIGVYMPATRTFGLKNSNSSGFADVMFDLGNYGDRPIVGDFDDDGIDTVGLYQTGSSYEGGRSFTVKNTNAPGPADANYVLERGIPATASTPLVGDWNGDGRDTFGLSETDGTPPTANISGGLYDARNQPSMTNGDFSVTTTDAGSGIARIALLDTYNGTTRWISGRDDICPLVSNNVTCPSTASWSYTLNPDVTPWGPGNHDLTLEVTDAAGNRFTKSSTVLYKVAYPTSWQYGGANHSVDTADEIAAVRTALGNTGYLNSVVWSGLAPADQPRIYPTSWTYGGTNHTLDGNEAAALLGTLSETDDAGWVSLWVGLSLADQAVLFPPGTVTEDQPTYDWDGPVPGSLAGRGDWHWGWWHRQKVWTDAQAKDAVYKLTGLTAMNASAALVLGVSGAGAPAAAAAAGLVLVGLGWVAFQIDTSADKPGDQVTWTVGLWCAQA